jgi:iron-sulfur cluster repair protein YtfE (RIC family)
MKITDAFLGEHGAFYAQFDYLEKAVPVAETLAQIQSLAALVTAALATHARLEDELLFSALDPHMGQMGPLTVMRMEHDEIENSLAQVQEVQGLAEAQRLVLNVIQVARGHFAKEEQILFPAADQMLGVESLAQLGKQWAAQRRVVIS